MRKVLAVGICAAGTWLGCASTLAQGSDKSETLLRWHFAGTDALLKEDGLATFREVHQMPETARLRDAILDNLGALAARRFTKGSPDQSAVRQTSTLIRPLLEQVLRFESRLVLQSPSADAADWVLAVRATGEDATLWSTNLWQLASRSSAGAPSSKQIQESPGWSAEGDGYTLAFVRDEDWVLLAGGHSPFQAHEKAISNLKKNLDQESDSSLAAEINLPAFAKLVRNEHLAHAPKLKLTSTPKGDGFRAELDLQYPERLGIKPEKWELPKGLIRDPLISFTAIQGFEERLAKNEDFAELDASATPNQLFLWAQSITPFSINAAAKVGNPEEFLKRLADKVIEEKNPVLKRMTLGELKYFPNLHLLNWTGLPLIVPFAKKAPAPDDGYLALGLFPLDVPATNKPPAELFKQLEKDNLIAYNWEITGAKMAQWRPLWQMSRFLRGKPIAPPDSPSEKWIVTVAPKLGNTITEATLKDERSIHILRQSEIGFNALELVLLAHLADRYEQATSAAPRAKPRPGKNTPPPLNTPAPRKP